MSYLSNRRECRRCHDKFFPEEFNSILNPTCQSCLNERRAIRQEKKKSTPIQPKKNPSKKKQLVRKYVNYRQYMDSKAWLIRSSEFKILMGSECEVCGSTDGVSSHHYNYLRLGRERNCDLFCLCGDCHGSYHEVFPSKNLPSDDGVKRKDRLRHIQSTVLLIMKQRQP